MKIPYTLSKSLVIAKIRIAAVIGSGWLFASYYASQYAGPIAIVSWVIGALMALALALLLSEIVTLYQQQGLFSRLLTISHNRDYGFVVAISNWIGVILVIPSEAVASVQYIGTSTPTLTQYIFPKHHLTTLGVILTCCLMLVFAVINYWGIRSLAKVNNVVTTIKLIIPVLTGIILFFTAFHPGNFTLYKGTIAPYGIGHAFSVILTSGIFYAFFGFNLIATYAQDLKNPKRNIPIALTASVLICLIIYLILQATFISALPSEMVAQGWHQLHFTSPLAQLMLLLGVNFWAVVLYADSILSPSGTGIVFTGSGSRMLTGMSRDQQMPSFFDRAHPVFNVSRRSLIFTVLFGVVLVVFFKNWQELIILVTVFQLISCVAVPLAFTTLRSTEKDKIRLFRLPFGKLIGYLTFLMVTFLLTQASLKALVLSLVLHIVFFTIYGFAYYKGNKKLILKAYSSSYSIFIYLAFTTLGGYLQKIHVLFNPFILILFFIFSSVLYVVMLKQKDYQKVSGL